MGLAPFSRDDHDFFFGRTRESALLAGATLSRSLIVVYGPSGVGKTSLLEASLQRSLAEIEPTMRSLVSVLSWRVWQPGFEAGLTKEIARVWLDSQSSAEWTLHECVKSLYPSPKILTVVDEAIEDDATAELDLPPRVLVLDQFEEYFLYHPLGSSRFEAELATLVNRDDHDCHVVISIRDDGVHLLDRLRVRIPNILSKMFYVGPLSSTAARDAINGPINVFNERHRPAENAISIGQDLVEALLRDTSGGGVREALEVTGAGVSVPQREQTQPSIDAPYLQLALERLWNSTVIAGRTELRFEDYRDLHGAKGILQRHLSDQLNSLSNSERALAAALFRHLVTASGSKVAHTVSDLFELVRDDRSLSVEPQKAIIQRLLDSFSGPMARITRLVQLPGSREVRFEVFHDALAIPILSWQMIERSRELNLQHRARSIRNGSFSVLMLLIVIAAAGIIKWRRDVNQKQKEEFAVQSALAKKASNERDDELILGHAEVALKDGNARIAILLTGEVMSRPPGVGVDEDQARAKAIRANALSQSVEVFRFKSFNKFGIQRISYGRDDTSLFGRFQPSTWNGIQLFKLDFLQKKMTSFAVDSGRNNDFIIGMGSLVHSYITDKKIVAIQISDKSELISRQFNLANHATAHPQQLATDARLDTFVLRNRNVFLSMYFNRLASSRQIVEGATDVFSLSPSGSTTLIYTEPASTQIAVKRGRDDRENRIGSIELYRVTKFGWHEIDNPIVGTNEHWRVSAWSDDSKYAVITQDTGNALVIEAETGYSTHVPANQISYASLNENGSCLAVGRLDGSVELFERREDHVGNRQVVGFVQTFNPLKLEDANQVTGLTFSPSGRFLAGSNDAGTVKVWQLGTGLGACAQTTASRNPNSSDLFGDLCPLSATEIEQFDVREALNRLRAGAASTHLTAGSFACGEGLSTSSH